MSVDQQSSVGPWNVRSSITTVVFAVFCAAVALHFTRQVDIGLYDETAYLQRGTAIDTIGLPADDMAPL